MILTILRTAIRSAKIVTAAVNKQPDNAMNYNTPITITITDGSTKLLKQRTTYADLFFKGQFAHVWMQLNNRSNQRTEIKLTHNRKTYTVKTITPIMDMTHYTNDPSWIKITRRFLEGFNGQYPECNHPSPSINGYIEADYKTAIYEYKEKLNSKRLNIQIQIKETPSGSKTYNISSHKGSFSRSTNTWRKLFHLFQQESAIYIAQFKK